MAVKMKYKKLFIPGPVEVKAPILKAMSHYMIGHRSQEFMDLYADTIPKLKQLLYTNQHVFLSTSSSTGIWELGARNLVEKKALCCVMGEFSSKWAEVVKLCGKETEIISVEPGKAVKADQIRAKLETGQFDALTLVHNETSTGVMVEMESIAKVMKDFPNVTFMVDAVSSLSGVKIEMDRLGIDLLFAGVQKAFGLPPGLTVFAVSEKAMEKHKRIPNRGYYFDLGTFQKYAEKNQTPSTPSISHIFALNAQLDAFMKEGLEKRFKRHSDMAEFTRKWALKKGFGLFAEEGYRSITLTAVDNNANLVNVEKLNNALAKKKMHISDGYGPFKQKTFRIAHMGDLNLKDLKELTSAIDDLMAKGVCK
ncbi:MAG: alanine--glyoxylate aminotransferase family protein [Candidatus Diapherotrites archaeon]